MKVQKSFLPKKINRQWYEIDASKKPLGRTATIIASILRGKTKRDFSPHLDMGDYVVAVNVQDLRLTGRKLEQKKYFRHSGFLGGLKTTSLRTIMNSKPEEVLRRAVYSMIDGVKFRNKIMSRLKIVVGFKHEYKIDKHLN